MCFEQENKNFIIQIIYSKLNKLDDLERIVEYNKIRNEVIKRVKKAYSNCDRIRLNIFYEDIFRILSLYESDYLILNLFLEKNNTEIINHLLKNNFDKLTFNFKSNKTLGFAFYTYLISKDNFTDSDINKFLKSQFIEKLNLFSEIDWKTETVRNYPLMTAYSSYITDDNIELFNERKLSFHLFVKLWNHYPEFKLPFNNTKAIMFYKNLNQLIESNSQFYILYKTLDDLYGNLFVSPTYIPLLDNIQRDEYKQGYLNHRKPFFDNISILENMINLNLDTDYLILLKKLTKDNHDKIVTKSKSIIIEKIKNFVYLKRDKIDIYSLNIDNKDITFLKQKIYYY